MYQDPDAQGWAPKGVKGRWHYFYQGKSLCGQHRECGELCPAIRSDKTKCRTCAMLLNYDIAQEDVEE